MTYTEAYIRGCIITSSNAIPVLGFKCKRNTDSGRCSTFASYKFSSIYKSIYYTIYTAAFDNPFVFNLKLRIQNKRESNVIPIKASCNN